MDDSLSCCGNVAANLRHTLLHLIDQGAIASAHYCATTESTSTDALEWLQANTEHQASLPKLFLTDRQTAGRGRQGNTWVSDDDALTFSLVIEFDQNSSTANLLAPAVGVAIAQAIEFVCAPAQVALKWPNDICYLDTNSQSTTPIRKLGGILIETVGSNPNGIVIGIGINLNRKPDLKSSLHSAPASLSELCQRIVRREEILAETLTSLAETLNSIHGSERELLEAYRQRCALSGMDLTLRHGDQIVTGFCTGITDNGSLEIVVDGKRLHYRSGEVYQVRRA